MESNPTIRQLVTTGIAPLVHSQFVLEGNAIVSAVFAGSFKRCALLWNLLLGELKASSFPQRLLLKLAIEYCQKYHCIKTFNTSPLELIRHIALLAMHDCFQAIARIFTRGVTWMSDVYVYMHKHARLGGSRGMLPQEIFRN